MTDLTEGEPEDEEGEEGGQGRVEVGRGRDASREERQDEGVPEPRAVSLLKVSPSSGWTASSTYPV